VDHYALDAASQDEDAAASVGIDVTREKLKITALSSAMCALGGAIYGQYQMYIGPDTIAGLGTSLNIVFAVVAGGMWKSGDTILNSPRNGKSGDTILNSPRKFAERAMRSRQRSNTRSVSCPRNPRAGPRVTVGHAFADRRCGLAVSSRQDRADRPATLRP